MFLKFWLRKLWLLFKNKHGITLQEYANALKIVKVKDLLYDLLALSLQPL